MGEGGMNIIHVTDDILRRALWAANDACVHYWCWLPDEYEKADALRVELSELLGEPREPQPYPKRSDEGV